jgi:hypothetical protein
MCDQALDKILIRNPEVDFGDLKVYQIIGYQLNYIPAKFLPTDLGVSTSLYRGYIATYELMENGELFLVKFEFPYSGRDTEIVAEKIEGDFTLVMKTSFYSPDTICIPFVNSVIETDKSKWRDETLDNVCPPPPPPILINCANTEFEHTNTCVGKIVIVV